MKTPARLSPPGLFKAGFSVAAIPISEDIWSDQIANPSADSPSVLFFLFAKAAAAGECKIPMRVSLPIIAAAAIIGHGTGSITQEFRRITARKTDVSSRPTANPHNQTLAVAIQLGVIGAVVLWAMWIAHIALFTGRNALAWLGLVLVAANILSSTVHSHLFDFKSGWLYVFGVGVLGGTILAERDRASKKTELGR